MDTQQQNTNNTRRVFSQNQPTIIKHAKTTKTNTMALQQRNTNTKFGGSLNLFAKSIKNKNNNAKMTTIPAKIGLSPQIKRKFNKQPSNKSSNFMIYEDNDKENIQPQPQSLENSQSSQNSLRNAIELADQALEESADVLMETSLAEEVFEENVENQPNYLLYNDKNFQSDIFDFCSQKEPKVRPDNYLRKQKEISTDMRTILIDWLIEVSYSSNTNYYSPDVLPLATNYIDRFLSKMGVPKSKLQLLGIVCLMLASKMLDTIPPDVIQLCELTDNTYSHSQVKKMEILVLEALEFNMYPPVHSNFYNYFLDKFCNASPDIDYTAVDRSRKALAKRSYSALICQFITEMTLLDYRLSIQFSPSQISLSAVIISRIMLKNMMEGKNLPSELQKSNILKEINNREDGLLNSIKTEGALNRELKNLIEHDMGMEQMRICMVGMITLWRSILAQEKIVAIVEKFCVQSIQEAFLDFRLCCLYGAPAQDDVMKVLQ